MASGVSADPQTVCDLIGAANGTTQNDKIRQAATLRLRSMNNMEGYPTALLKIWQSNKHDDLRLQSLMLFKNECKKFWSIKDNDLSDIKKQEKEQCKHLLLNDYIKESDQRVIKQVAQCIAKVARLDWPAKWPNLFQVYVLYM